MYLVVGFWNPHLKRVSEPNPYIFTANPYFFTVKTYKRVIKKRKFIKCRFSFLSFPLQSAFKISEADQKSVCLLITFPWAGTGAPAHGVSLSFFQRKKHHQKTYLYLKKLQVSLGFCMMLFLVVLVVSCCRGLKT